MAFLDYGKRVLENIISRDNNIKWKIRDEVSIAKAEARRNDL
jgi:hypothetical protein